MKDWVIMAATGITLVLLVRLNRKVNDMPKQEDVDLIVSNLTQISASVAGIATDQQELKELLEAAQEEADVDLSEAIALSTSLVERTQQLDASFPVPEVPREGEDGEGDPA